MNFGRSSIHRARTWRFQPEQFGINRISSEPTINFSSEPSKDELGQLLGLQQYRTSNIKIKNNKAANYTPAPCAVKTALELCYLTAKLAAEVASPLPCIPNEPNWGTVMNARATTFLLAILAAGCGPQKPSTANSPAAPPARFEIRDFKLSEQLTALGAVDVTGRGTLVALDDSVKKGTYFVWLTAKRITHKEDDVSTVLILRDGLATIETSDYVSKDNKDKVRVRYTDWRMTGYIRFQEGVIVSDAPTAVPQK
jgi:hypothetical protein